MKISSGLRERIRPLPRPTGSQPGNAVARATQAALKPLRVLCGSSVPIERAHLPMMIDAKLCLHFAEAAEHEEGDPTYRASLVELATEWLIDAERELQASTQSTRQKGKRDRVR